jgi:putative transposase
MTNVSTKSESLEPAGDTAVQLFDNWFDPIESGVRGRVRESIEELIQCELDDALAHAAGGPRMLIRARRRR